VKFEYVEMQRKTFEADRYTASATVKLHAYESIPISQTYLLRSSAATPKPAMCGHFKTGHMETTSGTRFFTLQ
jgi:hypothetical protein